MYATHSSLLHNAVFRIKPTRILLNNDHDQFHIYGTNTVTIKLFKIKNINFSKQISAKMN